MCENWMKNNIFFIFEWWGLWKGDEWSIRRYKIKNSIVPLVVSIHRSVWYRLAGCWRWSRYLAGTLDPRTVHQTRWPHASDCGTSGRGTGAPCQATSWSPTHPWNTANYSQSSLNWTHTSLGKFPDKRGQFVWEMYCVCNSGNFVSEWRGIRISEVRLLTSDCIYTIVNAH